MANNEDMDSFTDFLTSVLMSFIFLVWIYNTKSPVQDVKKLIDCTSSLLVIIIAEICDFLGILVEKVGWYLRRFKKRMSPYLPSPDEVTNMPLMNVGDNRYPPLLSSTMEDVTILTRQLPFLAAEEWEMARRWRNLSEEEINLHIDFELGLKTSHTYLLLDPEVSNNMPRKQYAIPLQEAWRTWISSIFYVGKGSRSSRPFEHLYRAAEIYAERQVPNEDAAPGPSRNTYRNRYYRNIDPKTERIISLWSRGRGPVIIRFSQDVMRQEALSRESIIIQSIGLENLIQEKYEQVYGPARQWENSRIQRLGCFLLYLGFQVYMAEGEKEVLHVDLIQTRPKRPKTN